MRRMTGVLTALIAVAVVLALPRPAAAERDAFENGFKHELGAIGARTVVGVGVGLFNAGGGGVGYNGLYVYPNHGYTYFGGGQPGYYYEESHYRRPYYSRPYYRPRYDHRGYGYGYGHHKPRRHVEYHHHEHYRDYGYGSCASGYSRYEYYRRY